MLAATNPVVSERLRDVNAFLEKLSSVERELGGQRRHGDRPTRRPARHAASGPVRAGSATRLWARRLSGFLCSDREADGEARVLKVAIDDNAAKRLDAEAEVLAALNARKQPRDRPHRRDRARASRRPHGTPSGVRRGGDARRRAPRPPPTLARPARPLGHRPARRTRVARRRPGVDHRDIKPSNLGVREQKSDRAKHLVLFDFSLAKASAATISAGTPPYLDPFLGTGTRQHWDSAAERYAAAVTLFEMATGHAPVYGDGETAPQFVERATIEPGDFDATRRRRTRPLLRDGIRARTPSNDMAQRPTCSPTWRNALAASVATTPEDADEVAERATPDTLASSVRPHAARAERA